MKTRRCDNAFLKFRKAISVALFAMMWPWLWMGLASAEEQHSIRYFAEWLIDRRVISEGHGDIGEIDDLVVHRNGTVGSVIIELEGLLGLGSKRVALEWDVLKKDEDRLMTTVSPMEVEHPPEFHYGQNGLYRSYYYLIPAYPMVAQEEEPGRIWAYSPEQYLASVIIGRNVITDEGESLGRIEDLLIENGSLGAVIISHGGLLEKEHTALPFQPLRISSAGVVYDIMKKTFDTLPPYPYEAIMEEEPPEGPFGEFYTPPGVVETDQSGALR